MKEKEILELLKMTGVIMEGHYLLTSGRHSARFLQCSQLLQYPDQAAKICAQMAASYRGSGVETVIGPAMGGVILAYETARALGARAIFAEPAEGKMVLRRGFTVRPGEKVLVVEDAVTTGGSVQKVLDLLDHHCADVVAVSTMIDRSGGSVSFRVSSAALLSMEIESYNSAHCPLCKEGIPLQKPKG